MGRICYSVAMMTLSRMKWWLGWVPYVLCAVLVLTTLVAMTVQMLG